MKALEKTVTIRVEIDSRIADLVYFVQLLREQHGAHVLNMQDGELIAAAKLFWDTQHGED
jgi:hypothetical protein